ncbi:MAG: ThiF family adenylyltransferase [Chloroflexi bacterium]|nr:ThiF family adenylyltransferase [Chloroflexota bacterium]
MVNERYVRHSLIDWFDQERLTKARAIVVGAGAVGNELLKNLCLLGVGHIHIVDYDRIEVHNLTRSVLFTEHDLGRYKAEAAAEACKEIDPNVQITFSCDNFWNSLTIGDLKKCDALFCCVDNFDARVKLNQLCLLSTVDFYNAAIDSRFVSAERYPFGSEKQTACYECNLPSSVYAKMRDRYSCGWLKKRAFEEKKVPTTIITSSAAGAALCSMYLQRYHPDSASGSCRWYLDTITLNSDLSALEPNGECVTCSRLASEVHYFRVSPNKPLDMLSDLQVQEDLPIFFSDRVVLDVACAKCGYTTAVNDLADKYDDRLLFCDHCQAMSNVPALRDFMTVSELERVFANGAPPAKFVYFSVDNTLFVLETEEPDAGTEADHPNSRQDQESRNNRINGATDC